MLIVKLRCFLFGNKFCKACEAGFMLYVKSVKLGINKRGSSIRLLS